MKTFAKFSVFMASILFTLYAFGGTGAGGAGFGKTRLLLQSFAYDQALLTIQGSTNIPENDTTPQLVIPADEYKDFVAEVESRTAPDSEPYVLKVELEGGAARYFKLGYIGKPGSEPLFLYLIEE